MLKVFSFLYHNLLNSAVQKKVSCLQNFPSLKVKVHGIFSNLSPSLYMSGMASSKLVRSSKLAVADRYAGAGESVWVQFGRLATENKALNIGQGFPDFFPPKYVTEALQTAAGSSNPFIHQYIRSYGHPRLVKALAQLYSPLLGHEVNMNEEILVTCGAYESLFCAFQGLVNPGDEVIIIEPFFDCYEPMVKVVGGIPVPIPLRPTKSGGLISSDDWKLDRDELASKFNDRTKIIVLNNPNNPLGKVYKYEELDYISKLCIKHDVVCLSDEVYEWLVYKPNKHLRIGSFPDMWQRTITVGSAGKTFSVTGWKIGWSVGPKNLIEALCRVHQNSVYTCCTPVQEAVAIGFETELPRVGSPDCYWNQVGDELLPKRDNMAAVLAEVGMMPTLPEGGYFMIADISNIPFDEDKSSKEPRDVQFVKWLTINKKLALIPSSVFYTDQNKHLGSNLVRLCFIKEDSTLEKAAEILRQWKASPSS